MNLVDSSGWLEYVAGGPGADAFGPAIEDVERLVVPTLCLYEVYRRLRPQRGEPAALEVVAAMMEGRVVDLDADLALVSARSGLEHRLPLADSVIYATARAHDATLWTQDSDFEGLDGVRYFPKERG